MVKRLVLLSLSICFLMGAWMLTAPSSAAGLAQNQRPELVLQTGHSKLVKSVVFGPDGKWLATASFDSTIRIWELEDGREIRSLAGHKGGVNSLACSPDGRALVSGGSDGTIRVWDVETGAELNKFVRLTAINSVKFSPDGKRIAFSGGENSVVVIELSSAQPPVELGIHKDRVSVLAFSKDGKFVASGSEDKTIRIWDLEKRGKSRELTGNTGGIGALRFSDDGKLLASGGLDNSVRLWQASNGDSKGVLKGHAAGVMALFFASAEVLVSADKSGTIKKWNFVSKSEISSIGGKTDVNTFGEAESAGFNSDGTLLATGNESPTATIISTADGARAAVLENNTIGYYGVSFSRDKHWMAAAGFDNTVKLWDLQTGQSLSPLKGHSGRVRAVVFLPDDRHLVSASSDNSIRVWDGITSTTTATLKGHTKQVATIAAGSIGKILVSGSSDQTVGLWDLENMKEPRLLKGHTGEVISVSITSDERFAASASMDGTIKLWDVATGTLIRTIEPRAGEVDTVSFSPDGKYLASGGINKTVSLWDVATGDLIRQFTGHSEQIYSVGFSSDGKRIVSTGVDRTVRTWNSADGKEIQKMEAHVGSVFTAGFLPDDKQIASASEDGSIIIWNSETGARISTLLSLRNSDDWLVVTPEGFFDGSQPSWRQISWRFDRNTFNVKPVEEFFSEFWLPGLLSELLNDRKLPGNLDISTKDRRQPVLRLAVGELGNGPVVTARELKVVIDISQAPAGAKDVRLFRNGTLTKVWRGDVLKGQSRIRLEASIPMVAGENRVTVYAFNSDDIKSKDATLTITGSPSLARRGVLYILAIGINSYANEEFNLNYAVDDANEFAGEFRRQQIKLNTYERVDLVTLLNGSATKANILNALSGLSAKIQPEDAVAVYFAGHGLAEQQHFYLIPHDLGYAGMRDAIDAAAIAKITASGLSNEELEKAVENIDAGQFLLVIDACNSGQALETQETRRGPMNSKGLAQLAHEKGIYILTASQGFQAAKEDARLGHGYLTFALIEEGLKGSVADRKPKDGQILIREWLDFAAERVPQIDQEENDRNGKKRSRQLEREKANKAGKADARALQRPRVFYRREVEPRPMVVGSP